MSPDSERSGVYRCQQPVKIRFCGASANSLYFKHFLRFSSYKSGPAPDRSQSSFSLPGCDGDRVSPLSLGLLWKLGQNFHSPEPAAAAHHFPLHPADPAGLARPHRHPDGAAGVCQQVCLTPASWAPAGVGGAEWPTETLTPL